MKKGRKWGSITARSIADALTVTPSEANSVIAIDVSNYAFRAYFASRNWSDERRAYLKTARNMLAPVIRKAQQLGGKSMLFLALDAGRPDNIKKNFPEYKANRDTEIDENPIPYVLEELQEYPTITVKAPGHEADSVIATMLRHRKTAKLCGTRPYFIVSKDKDLYQLLSHRNVLVIPGGNDPYIDSKYVYNKFGVKAERIPLYLSLYGDPSDNIKAVVPRLRKKLVNPIINRSKSMRHFFELVAKSGNLSERERDGLLAAKKDIVKRYRVLFSLRTDCPLKFKVFH